MEPVEANARINHCPVRHNLSSGQEREPMYQVQLNPALEFLISIVLGSVTVLVGWRVVLGTKPLPIGAAIFITAVDNSLGKLFFSVFHFPAALSYSLPTLAFLILSYFFFKPTLTKLFLYWLVGFAAYLVIHVLISSLLGWTFMFPFWKPHIV
jgi:hypothetical protein